MPFAPIRPIGLLVFSRALGNQPWTATALTSGDILEFPEIGAELLVDDIYASHAST